VSVRAGITLKQRRHRLAVRALTTAGLRLLKEVDRPRDQRLKKKRREAGEIASRRGSSEHGDLFATGPG